MCESKIQDANLSIRTKKILESAGVITFCDLESFKKSDLLKYRGFGERSFLELKDFMKHKNIFFMDEKKTP